MQAFYTSNETQKKKVVFVSAVHFRSVACISPLVPPSLITLFLKSQVWLWTIQNRVSDWMTWKTAKSSNRPDSGAFYLESRSATIDWRHTATPLRMCNRLRGLWISSWGDDSYSVIVYWLWDNGHCIVQWNLPWASLQYSFPNFLFFFSHDAYPMSQLRLHCLCNQFQPPKSTSKHVNDLHSCGPCVRGPLYSVGFI